MYVTETDAIENAIKVLQKSLPRCEHGNIEGRCDKCGRCEHGATESAHCEACHVNDDPAWRTAPVTDAEIAQLRRWFADYDRQYIGPHQAVRRYTPYGKRNYCDTEVSFLPILLAEYIALRAGSEKRRPSPKR